MTILILEDNDDRIAAFHRVTSDLVDVEIQVWRNAPDMIRDLAARLPQAGLISLDHDLVFEDGEPDPGDGVDVARALAKHTPVCPVILHSSNVDRVKTMKTVLEASEWETLRVRPFGIGENWIRGEWLPKARQVIEAE